MINKRSNKHLYCSFLNMTGADPEESKRPPPFEKSKAIGFLAILVWII